MTELIFRNGRCINREDGHFEAKSFSRGIPESLWETYSAFANTSGGTIVLGLEEPEDDQGYVIGGVRNAEGIRDELWSTLNNPQKVSINIMMDRDLKVIEVDGKKIIVMDVPEAHRTLRPIYIKNVNSGTYKRNGSGDYHCNGSDIAAMYRDASDARDGLISAEATISDLRSDSIEAYRNMMAAHNPSNDWVSEPTEEFLRLIGAAARSEGKMKPTIAGLIMFGDEASISAEMPGFSLDYREYDSGGDEWTLRRLSGTPGWSGNLFEFYSFVINRIPMQVGTGFKVPDGINREDDTMLIRALREMVTNAVVNADYWGRGSVTVESRRESYSVTNAGTFRIPIETAEAGGDTDPRNPRIMKMLGLIGRAEKAGTGVRMMFSACRTLNMGPPSIIEHQRPDRVNVTISYSGRRIRNGIEELVLKIISHDPKATAENMAKEIGVGKSSVMTTINKLKDEGVLSRVGGPRGRWVINDTGSKQN